MFLYLSIMFPHRQEVESLSNSHFYCKAWHSPQHLRLLRRLCWVIESHVTLKQGLWCSSSWSQPKAWRPIFWPEPLNHSHSTKVYLFSMSQRFPRCCPVPFLTHLYWPYFIIIDLKTMYNPIRSLQSTVSHTLYQLLIPNEISSGGSQLNFGFDKASYLYLINWSRTFFLGNRYAVITSTFQSIIPVSENMATAITSVYFFYSSFTK